MVERFTAGARQIIISAGTEARRGLVRSEHLLLVIVRDAEGRGANLLRHVGVDLEMLAGEIHRTPAPAIDSTASGRPAFDPDAKRILELSFGAARELGHRRVGIEHLLLGIVRAKQSTAGELLRRFGVSGDRLRQAITEQSGSSVEQFEHGDRVRILEGPFKNFPAVVEEPVAEEGRVRVAVRVFGRLTPLDLGWWELEHNRAS